jgi:hypothetical protein
MYKLAKDSHTPLTVQEDNRMSEANPEDRRLVEILLDDGDFHKIYFRELKAGDCFSLTDPKTKEAITDKYGQVTHVASTDAFLAKHKTLGTIVYHIQIEDMPPPVGEEK